MRILTGGKKDPYSSIWISEYYSGIILITINTNKRWPQYRRLNNGNIVVDGVTVPIKVEKYLNPTVEYLEYSNQTAACINYNFTPKNLMYVEHFARADFVNKLSKIEGISDFQTSYEVYCGMCRNVWANKNYDTSKWPSHYDRIPFRYPDVIKFKDHIIEEMVQDAFSKANGKGKGRYLDNIYRDYNDLNLKPGDITATASETLLKLGYKLVPDFYKKRDYYEYGY